MDIQNFGKDTLRIKSKKTTVAVDPKKDVSKFDAEAILLTNGEFDSSRVNDFRVLIDGAGEYEISGLKISALKSGKDILYVLSGENANTLIAKASALNSIEKEKLSEYQVVVINADSEVNVDIITAMEPRVIVLYGEKSVEGAKVLGKENLSKSSKVSITDDKFPEELEVLILS